VAACPDSRVASGKLEAFVVERLREVGRDPEVLRAALDADEKDRESRRPELVGEMRRLGAERARLTSERESLVDAVAQGGSAGAILLPRWEEADRELAEIAQREADAQRELAALDAGAIDQEDLKAALEDFEAVWAELFPKERARMLALLLERVEFDAQAGDVAITFRRGGPRGVAR
jgi:site-specific DNA recombinase